MTKQRVVSEVREPTRTGEVHVTVVDDSTGEILYDFWERKTGKPTGRMAARGCDFIKLYRTNVIDMIKRKKLDFKEAGLLYMLSALCGWKTPYIVHPDTRENMSCSDLSRLLGKDRKHLWEDLEKLCQKGCISKVFRGDGVPCHYMMNTNLAFFGNTIDDPNHLDTFRDCNYEPAVEVRYRKTPEKKT